MLHDDNIWIATKANGEAVCLLSQKACRHGLITGGSNKEVDLTARLLAEGFSSLGVPVFMTDIHRNLAGMMAPGNNSELIKEMISHMGSEKNSFCFQGFPVTLWDVFGKAGTPLRVNVSQMESALLSQMLNLSALQSDILKTIYSIASDTGLLLTDIKDLKAVVNYVRGRVNQYAPEYGQIRTIDLDDILRALVKLETGDVALFFGEPSFAILDLLQSGIGGNGVVNVLDSNLLVRNVTLYTSVLLWLLSELCEMMPDTYNLSRPKLAFFIDEAHFLFRDNNRVFLKMAESVIKILCRKGVAVFFCTQKMQDIPDDVLRHLENRIQLSPYAYTPAQLKEARLVAKLFRKNPAFNTFDTLKSLSSGEALFSLIGKDNQPCPVEKGYLLPPQSNLVGISDYDRERCIKGNTLNIKYGCRYDPESAYEFLSRIQVEEAAAAERAKYKALLAKEKAKLEAAEAREEARRAAMLENGKKRTTEVAERSLSSTFTNNETSSSKKSSRNAKGTFGEMYGNLGARLGRELIGKLFKE